MLPAPFAARKGVVNKRSEGSPQTGQACAALDSAIGRNSRKFPHFVHR
jgi:hypothetical protein